MQDADQLTVICVIFVRLKYINIRFRALTVHVRMQVQVALVVMPFQFGQDSPFVSDHLVFAEVRLRDRCRDGYRTRLVRS